MKKSSVNILLVMLLFVAACKKNGGGTEIKPVVTPVGANDGTAVSQTIGNGGGTIVSGDGEMELIIPPGALTSNTDITIQPIINHAPGGRRKAYRCTPDGQQFAKNITIKFHYTDQDAAATQPEYMMMAFQTGEGSWQVLENIVNDPGSKTISAAVNHFTDFTAFDVMRIDPPNLYLRPNETGQYRILATGISDLDGILLITALLERPETWKANGVTGGNSTHGTIGPSANGSTGEYRAPATAPATNPVVISAEVNFPFIINGQRFNRGILTANAFIIGNRYKVQIETSALMNSGIGDQWRAQDHCQFTVNIIGSGGTVTDMQNSNPTFLRTASNTNGCGVTLDVEGTGPIHLRDFNVLGVTASSITGDVYVSFDANTAEIQPQLRIACPNVPERVQQMYLGSFAGAVIAFKDNGHQQVINSGTANNSITITITPLQ